MKCYIMVCSIETYSSDLKKVCIVIADSEVEAIAIVKEENIALKYGTWSTLHLNSIEEFPIEKGLVAVR